VAKTADFSPDGRYFAYGDSRVIVRESTTLKTIATLEVGALTLRFAPRSHWLASAQDQVIIWDTDRWQALRTLPEGGHTALFSPNERWFVAGISGGYRVWDTTTWHPVGDCTGAPVYRWHARHAVAFSPDSESLLTVAGDGYPLGDHLRVWQLPSLEEREPVRVADGEISAVAFSPEGRKLVTGLFDGRVVVWDFATRRPLMTKREHTAWIPAVMSARDGRTFFTASADRTLIVWDRETCEPRVRLRGHTGELWSAALSPDGQRAISGSNDGTTKVWVTHPSPKEVPLTGPNLVAGFSDGGRRLIGVSTNAFVMWDPVSGMRADTPLPPIQAPVLTADWGRPYAVQPTELVGVRGCSDGTVEVWDLRTGSRKAQWSAHEQRVGTLAFSADGRILATGGKSGDVKVWDFAAQQELARFGPAGAPVLCVAFSPDGRSLAASSENDGVWVWSLESRQRIRLGGNLGPVFSVAFSPDGTCLANTTMAANEVRLWELPSTRPLAPLRGHLEGVCSVAFSPDGKTLATGCTDRRVTLWNFATRQEMAKIRPGSAIPMVAFSPDGAWLTVGDLAGRGRQIRAYGAPSFAAIDLVEKSRIAKPVPQ
jgi:WD40 repeat protein